MLCFTTGAPVCFPCCVLRPALGGRGVFTPRQFLRACGTCFRASPAFSSFYVFSTHGPGRDKQERVNAAAGRERAQFMSAQPAQATAALAAPVPASYHSMRSKQNSHTDGRRPSIRPHRHCVCQAVSFGTSDSVLAVSETVMAAPWSFSLVRGEAELGCPPCVMGQFGMWWAACGGGCWQPRASGESPSGSDNHWHLGFLNGPVDKNLPAVQETQGMRVQFR